MRTCTSATVLLTLCLSAPAGGQTPQPPQPPQPPAEPQGTAVFGGAEARGLPERLERLDLLVQVFGGYDDDVLAEQSGRGPSQERLTSAAAGLATGVGAALAYSRPGLLYSRPGARGEFRAWGDTSLRYYPGLDHLTGRYHRAGLQISLPVHRRLTLFASPRADYTPRFSFELLPGIVSSEAVEAPQPSTPATDTSPAAIDYSVVASNSLRYGVTGAAEIALGTRSTLTVDGGYTKRRSDLAAYEMELRQGGVGFDYQLTSNAALDLGYSYIDGLHGSGITTTAHNLDLGVDYRRPLSRSRRTFVSVSTGSTIAESEVRGRRIQATGSASLEHQIRRTWTAMLEYRRRLHYVDGFDRPLFGDAITAGVNGMLTRRMELVGRASYTSGSVGISSGAPRYDSYIASLRVRRALTRRLAGYVEALFYHYAFEEAAPRPPGLPRTFDRVALRGGLSVWVPLVP